MHGGLQAQQQVGESGLSGSWQAGVQAAALLPQVQFAGFSQGVTDPVVLRDELLTDRQSVTALPRMEKWEKVSPSSERPAFATLMLAYARTKSSTLVSRCFFWNL